MHPSAKRLLDAAKAATAAERAPVVDFAGVGARLGVSSAVLTNWKVRGLSKDGALDAERVFGCYAAWLLDGKQLPPPAAVNWPFERVNLAAFQALTEREKGAVEDVMVMKIGEIEDARKRR